jgi:hypothetical protein
MSKELEQAKAKYDELVDAVHVLDKKIIEFRRIFEPECIDFGDINGMLHDMLREIDDQLIEENLE